MKKSESIINKLSPVLALALVAGVWALLTGSGAVGAYMLPSPGSVVRVLVDDRVNLWNGARYTLLEAFYGLGIGVAVAVVVATVMDAVPVLRRAIYPILIISQTIPSVAIAPLLVVWMGFGMAPKIALIAITTFFPIAIGLLTGYATDRDQIDLLRAMGANRRQIFFHVRWPGALPHFFSGLEVSASYAVVGAVIAEWMGGDSGLGMYMTRVRKAYRTDKVFAVILVIVAVSLLLMLAVHLLAKVSMPWKQIHEKENKTV